MRNWKILEWGTVPQNTKRTCAYTCLNCMAESSLPVSGTPIAQVGEGLVFDRGDHAAPALIQCPICRTKYGKGI
jgi:hypothetical protein